MKKLITIGSLLATTAFGQFLWERPIYPGEKTAVFTATVATNYVILTNANKIAAVQLVGGSATSTVDLFDANSNTTPTFGTAYLSAAYTGNVWSASNVTSTVVTSTGVTNLYTNTLWYAVSTAYPASTNALTPIVSLAVPSAQTVSIPVDVVVARGLVLRINTNATIVVTYRSN